MRVADSRQDPPSRILSSEADVAIETPRKDRLAEQRRALPDEPGVYLFRDARGRVIYVGKAKSIRKRVASHFSSRSTLSAPTSPACRIIATPSSAASASGRMSP